MAHLRYALGDGPDGRFSDIYLQQRVGNAAMEMRSRFRGVLLLCALIRELQEEVPFHPDTGVYLASHPGPSHPKLQEIAAQESGPARLGLLERALPPKDFFVANPAMHAAQVSLEFGLHGSWITFHSPARAFDQACYYARGELRDGTVPGALVAAIHTLEDRPHNGKECLFAQYATKPHEIVQPGSDRLPRYIERIRTR